MVTDLFWRIVLGHNCVLMGVVLSELAGMPSLLGCNVLGVRHVLWFCAVGFVLRGGKTIAYAVGFEKVFKKILTHQHMN